MEKKIIEVKIAALELLKRGALDGAEDTNLFRFVLSYPAEGIPGLETIKTVKSNKPIPKNWASDFDKAIVFKTPLRGKAKLTVEVVAIDKDSDGEKFFKRLFKTLFGAVVGVWTGGFGNAYVGAVVNGVGTSLAEQIDSDDDIDVIGAASFTLNSENLKPNLRADLKVAKNVVKKVFSQSHGGHPSRRRRRVTDKVVIQKGKNGHLELAISEIG